MKQTIRNVKKTMDQKRIKSMKRQRNRDVTNCPVRVCLIQKRKSMKQTITKRKKKQKQ